MIYLDNNATTPCAPEVLESMVQFIGGGPGNPASPHLYGRRAFSSIAEARERVAAAIDCDESELFFTSGATEANNLVLFGAAKRAGRRRTLVTSEVEHKSVLGPLSLLQDQGFSVVKIPVRRDGLLDMGALHEALNDTVFLVSIQAANNEVGTLQPIQEIAAASHEHGALMHCDAAQLLGKLPFSVSELGVDLMSFSSHKIYGPMGIGALFARQPMGAKAIAPLMVGGGQERGLRPGTPNVPGIVGTGVACQLCIGKIGEEAVRLAALRDHFEESVRSGVPDLITPGSEAARLPGTTLMVIPGVEADLLLSRIPELCLGVGSACSSGTLAPSHVLSAMGIPPELAGCAIRVSIGRYNTASEVDQAAALIVDQVATLKGMGCAVI